MKKILLSFLVLLSSVFQTVYAEKIPVSIAPLQAISTNYDEIETGDYITFVIVNDVYTDGKLYLKKGTPVEAFVDFFHPNGWVGDSAEIKIKTFETTDSMGKKVIINYPLDLNGYTLKANDIKQYLSWVFTSLIRGSEIYIEPDTKIFNIFIETEAQAKK